MNLRQLARPAVIAMVLAFISLGGGQTLLEATPPLCGSPPLVFTPCVFTFTSDTMSLQDDCTTNTTIEILDGFTLEGNSYTITAVDPSPLLPFQGAVVKNGGSTAHVQNLCVQAQLVDACKGGDERLRGILFDFEDLDDPCGSSSTNPDNCLITNNTVMHIKRGTGTSCQEGNGIEIRNVLFDTPRASVTISGNTVADYNKNGITANGTVAATIEDNAVTGTGPITYIAQNGIQIGFLATALVQDNTVSKNNYAKPNDPTIACGLLLYKADGVEASGNKYSANERNMGNFGKGGGQYSPSFP